MLEPVLLAQALVNGASVALVYILVALGLTLIFSIMGVINFAHGEFYMLGGFSAYYIAQLLGVNYLVMILLTIVIVGALGYIVERLVFSPLRSQPLSAFISSLGLLWLMQSGATLVFGAGDRGVTSPYRGVLRYYGLAISYERLFVMAVAVVLIIGLYSVLRWTKVGLALRAVSQDRDAAALQGINVEATSGVAFAVGCALAGAAGALLAPVFYVSPTMGTLPVVKAFIIVILGGMGSLPGAIVGGALLGVLESIGPIFLSAAAVELLGFVAIVFLLLVKPTGIMKS
jgi:branched-chain amino acid transport system permease protein